MKWGCGTLVRCAAAPLRAPVTPGKEGSPLRTAIVGAGLAGMACALELERLGLSCELFEKRDRVGKQFNTVETMISALTQDSYKDVFALLRQDLHLPINPSCHADGCPHPEPRVGG